MRWQSQSWLSCSTFTLPPCGRAPWVYGCTPCGHGCAKCEAKCEEDTCVSCTQPCDDANCASCPGRANTCTGCLPGFFLDHGKVCRQALQGAACLSGVEYCDDRGQRVACKRCHWPRADGTCVLRSHGAAADGSKACAFGSYRPTTTSPCILVSGRTSALRCCRVL